MSAVPLLKVGRLTISFPARGGPALAVREVSFALRAAEVVALVGESGSGKTLTALTILGLLPAAARLESGTIRLGGEEVLGRPEVELRAIRGRRIAMVFQEPRSALNPVLDLETQIVEAVRAHSSVDRQTARQRALALLELLRMPDAARRLKAFPHELSGGQRQRAMLAVALAAGPEILLADEPTTALDPPLELEVLQLLARLRDELKVAILWITHDLQAVAELSDHILVMHAGEVVEQGPTAKLLAAPLHPYTRALLAARPRLAGAPGRARFSTLPGQAPSPEARPAGCAFHPRCAELLDRCRHERPGWHEPAPGHGALCWLLAPSAEPVG